MSLVTAIKCDWCLVVDEREDMKMRAEGNFHICEPCAHQKKVLLEKYRESRNRMGNMASVEEICEDISS